MATLFTLVRQDKQALLAAYPFGVSAASGAGFPACGFTELSSSVAFSAGMNWGLEVPRTRRQECLRYGGRSARSGAGGDIAARCPYHNQLPGGESRASMGKALVEERIR
jgi:hypothetical protein